MRKLAFAALPVLWFVIPFVMVLGISKLPSLAVQAEEQKLAQYPKGGPLSQLVRVEEWNVYGSPVISYLPRLVSETRFDFTTSQRQFFWDHPDHRLIAVVPNYDQGELVGVWFYTEKREKK